MRVLIIDQEVLFAEALECLLEVSFGLTIRAKYVKNIAHAIDFLTNNEFPDLIFLDVNLLEKNDAHIIEHLHKISILAPVIIISEMESPFFEKLMIDAGASGFISKTSDRWLLLDVVETVLSGNVYSAFYEKNLSLMLLKRK